jgi:hypothetical protein
VHGIKCEKVTSSAFLSRNKKADIIRLHKTKGKKKRIKKAKLIIPSNYGLIIWINNI